MPILKQILSDHNNILNSLFFTFDCPIFNFFKLKLNFYLHHILPFINDNFQQKNQNALQGRCYFVSRPRVTKRRHCPGGAPGITNRAIKVPN